jgi:hypothetical protein
VLHRAFDVSFTPLTPGDVLDLPDRDSLKRYLNSQSGETPHALEVLAYDVEGEGQQAQLFLRPVRVYEAGTPIRFGRPLGKVALYTPALNRPLYVFFSEVPRDSSSTSPVHYVFQVNPTAHEFFATVTPEGDGWVVKWSGAVCLQGPERVRENELPEVPEHRSATAHPNIVLVIESTLGMARMLRAAKSSSISTTDTDFAVLKKFCDVLVRYLRNTQARFLLMFYGDDHSVEQNLPYEFSGIRNAHYARPEISFLPEPDADEPPAFVGIDSVLQSIDSDFEEKQSVTCDWYKSLEKAAHALHELPWEEAERAAIWIGQSSPHTYVPEGEQPNEEQYGFNSPYDFLGELKRSTEEKQIRHLAFFVASDIPNRSLRKEASRYWRKIGGDRFCLEIQLTRPEEADFEGDIAEAINLFFSTLHSTTLIQLAEVLDMPFAYLPDTIRIVQPQDED